MDNHDEGAAAPSASRSATPRAAAVSPRWVSPGEEELLTAAGHRRIGASLVGLRPLRPHRRLIAGAELVPSLLGEASDPVPIAAPPTTSPDVHALVREQMLSDACRALTAAPSEPGFVLVAMHTVQLGSVGAAERVLDAVSMSGRSATTLLVQASPAAFSRADAASDALRRLRAAGARVIVGNVTGTADLALLRQTPVDGVRLDPDVASDEIDEDLVRAVVRAARSLHLTSVAPSRCDRPAVDRLAELGVDYGPAEPTV